MGGMASTCTAGRDCFGAMMLDESVWRSNTSADVDRDYGGNCRPPLSSSISVSEIGPMGANLLPI